MEVRQRVDAGDLTVSSLARRSGVSQPTLSNWLSGRRRLTVRTLDCVLGVLRGRLVLQWERERAA